MVLTEIVKHPVKDEEARCSQAQKADIDWDVLNTVVMARKEQLIVEV